uniref:Uncharacterized protein n=1 Tax=Lepeophtheirus salmonis TaxID=72036 RepID=A0A0K2UYL4_LEPSM
MSEFKLSCILAMNVATNEALGFCMPSKLSFSSGVAVIKIGVSINTGEVEKVGWSRQPPSAHYVDELFQVYILIGWAIEGY